MIKKLTRTGNSIALVLDRPLLEAVNIDPDQPVEVSTNGEMIVISPVKPKRRERRFKAAAAKVIGRYAGVFKRLAE
jgi:antitoxin MazE